MSVYDPQELPTRPYPALAEARPPTAGQARADRSVTQDDGNTIQDQPSLSASSLSATLPVTAEVALKLFSQCEFAPHWMAVIRSARILSRYLDGRPECVAFTADLERASVGYTLRYVYDDELSQISWSTSPGAHTQVSGSVRFQEMGPRACMMHFEATLQKHQSLPAWADPMFNGHPASSVVNDFRQYLDRTNQLDIRCAP